MKKLLVPYDFSESARTALDYAFGLNSLFASEIILLSVNSYPVMSPEAGLALFTNIDSKEETLQELQKIVAASAPKQTQSIRCFCEEGDVSDHVNKLSEKENIDLIIMGINGHGNGFLTHLAGSSSITVAKESRFPLLIVPQGYLFEKPMRIGFACTDIERTVRSEVMGKVEKFAANLHADLNLLHFVGKTETPVRSETAAKSVHDEMLNTSPRHTYIVTDKDPAKGILDVLNNGLFDLIVIEPRKHNFFENLFHHGLTAEIVMNTPVPVLCIHE
jgi:nucleotide-binding universal stress UspA family protein